MSDLVSVKCLKGHMRGCLQSVNGRLYRVDPASGLLHLQDGSDISPQAGCVAEDAERLLGFDDFQRIVAPPKPRVSAEPFLEKAQKKVAEQPKSSNTVVASEEKATIDLSALDGSVSSLKRSLRRGKLDDRLAELLAAEQAGKTRKSAVEAIEERINNL